MMGKHGNKRFQLNNFLHPLVGEYSSKLYYKNIITCKNIYFIIVEKGILNNM